ncbi:PREDICTED: uncharacterized protein LOC101295957 [Fragaria vesca subsp. vesca]
MTWLEEFHKARHTTKTSKKKSGEKWTASSYASKLNVDGAFLPFLTHGGVGGILRDCNAGLGIRVSIKPTYRITPPPQLLTQVKDIPRSNFQFDFDFERKVLAKAEKETPNWGKVGLDNLLPQISISSHQSDIQEQMKNSLSQKMPHRLIPTNDIS